MFSAREIYDIFLKAWTEEQNGRREMAENCVRQHLNSERIRKTLNAIHKEKRDARRAYNEQLNAICARRKAGN